MSVLENVKSILGDSAPTDEELNVYISMAQRELLSWTYGKDNALEELPSWLEPILIMAVVTGFNQSGAEGELQEMVDGVTHTFKHDSMIAFIHNNAPGHAKLL